MLSTIITALFLQFVGPACPMTILIEHVSIRIQVDKEKQKYVGRVKWNF